VNDGAQCQFSKEFSEKYAAVMITLSQSKSIGEKRNIAAKMVESEWILSMDDDDFSLPNRITKHFESLGGRAVYHKTNVVLVAVNQIDNIIGYKFGLYYGTSIIRREVALQLKWDDINWCEDHHFFQNLQKSKWGKNIVQTADSFYIVRRHQEDRASSKYGKEKDVMEVDFVTEECINIQHQVNNILKAHFKQYVY